MAEPPHKRARRPDSKQMWDEQDRRAPLPSRERDEPRDRDRRDHRDHRERDRRYRSRSPRDSRSGRDRGGRDRERDPRDHRGSGRRDDREDDRGSRRDEHRDSRREMERNGRRDRDRGRDGQRDWKDDRERRKDSRSRSPRKESDPQAEIVRMKSTKLGSKEDEHDERLPTPPPVSFKVKGQDHDRMDVDRDMNHGKKNNVKVQKPKVEAQPDEDEELVVVDDGLDDMQAMMGFGGFGTTHQKKVAGNDIYAVRKEKKTEYRQYMNRVGGFNRPLSPTRQ